MRSALISLAVVFAVSGCSTAPPPIRHAPPGAPPLSAVRGNIGAYQDKLVRWGGTVVSVENHADRTVVQIVERELDRLGEPKDVRKSSGRFLLEVDEFLDPVVYSEGSAVTVVGSIAGEAPRMVGEHSLTLPVVRAHQFHLWPERDPSNRHAYPYPMYGPYRPFWWYHPYPYWW